MFRRTASLFYVLRYASWLSKRPHFWGLRTQTGAMTPNFELGRDFCVMHLPQVSSSYVYSFGSYRVDKQTNKHTNRRRWKHPTFCGSLRYDVGQRQLIFTAVFILGIYRGSILPKSLIFPPPNDTSHRHYTVMQPQSASKTVHWTVKIASKMHQKSLFGDQKSSGDGVSPSPHPTSSTRHLRRLDSAHAFGARPLPNPLTPPPKTSGE